MTVLSTLGGILIAILGVLACVGVCGALAVIVSLMLEQRDSR